MACVELHLVVQMVEGFTSRVCLWRLTLCDFGRYCKALEERWMWLFSAVWHCLSVLFLWRTGHTIPCGRQSRAALQTGDVWPCLISGREQWYTARGEKKSGCGISFEPGKQNIPQKLPFGSCLVLFREPNRNILRTFSVCSFLAKQ